MATNFARRPDIAEESFVEVPTRRQPPRGPALPAS
jgi:hypothetical protein